jgi:hypothetical protein
MSSMLDTAMYWVDHGVSVIPVIHKSKLPCEDWRQYQTQLPKLKELSRWFSGKIERNIGIVCGGENRLVVLDFDSMPGFYKFISERVCKSSKWKYVYDNTYKVKSPRGVHLYVRTEEETRSTKLIEDKIDIRSCGNMVVAPPSIHPSGNIYSEISSRNIVTIDSISDILPEKNMLSMPNLGINDAFNTTIDNIHFMESQYNHNNSIELRQVKNFIPILDFVSRYTRVKRTSNDGRWWMANCIDPMHKDKKPSLRIDTLSNRVKCLSGSCRLYHEIGFDIFDLYSILSGIDRKQTISYFKSLLIN